MDHSAIASAYNQIAERWLDDRFNQADGIRQHERALRFLQAGTEGWALNVGCGCNMRFNAPMRGHGLQIEGIDISGGMIALEQQRPLMLKLMHALAPGGVFVLTAGGLDAADTHVDSTMGPEVYYSTLGIAGLLDVLEEAGCVCRHLEFDQYPEKHLYVVVQRR